MWIQTRRGKVAVWRMGYLYGGHEKVRAGCLPWQQHQCNPGAATAVKPSTKLCQTAGESCQCRRLNLYRPSLSLTLTLASLWLIVSALQTLSILSCLKLATESKGKNESIFSCCKQRGALSVVCAFSLQPVYAPHQTPLFHLYARKAPHPHPNCSSLQSLRFPHLLGLLLFTDKNKLKEGEIMKIWWEHGRDSDPGILKLTWAALPLSLLHRTEWWHGFIKNSSLPTMKSTHVCILSGLRDKQQRLDCLWLWCVWSCLVLQKLTFGIKSTVSRQQHKGLLYYSKVV